MVAGGTSRNRGSSCSSATSGCHHTHPDAACGKVTSTTSASCGRSIGSATRKPGSASTTLRPGSRTRHRTCWWRRRCSRRSTSASDRAASCCRTTIPPSWRTAWRCSTTWPRGASTSGWPPAACPATGRCSTWTAFRRQNREMTRESLDIILRLWTEEEPFELQGQVLDGRQAGPDVRDCCSPHIMPFQKPHPPIGVAGPQQELGHAKMAGEHGFLPMSLNLNPAYVKSHWDAVEEARALGRTPRGAPTGGWSARCSWPRPTRRPGSSRSRRMMGRMMRRVLPAAAGRLRLHRVPEARSRTCRLGCHRRVLRAAQLADRLAGDGRREAAAGLRGSRRLRRTAGVRLRLRRQPGVAHVAAPAQRGGAAALRGPRAAAGAHQRQRLTPR